MVVAVGGGNGVACCSWSAWSRSPAARRRGRRVITNNAPAWVERVLDRFRGVRPSRGKVGGWQALCPAHPDRTPSLSLWLGRDGRLMLGCWAGCEKKAILGAVGLKMSEMFEPAERSQYGEYHARPARRLVATYSYTDEAGKTLFQSLRYEPKDF